MQSTIDLPTISDIEASTDVLSIRTNAIKVVRVKERFTVKIGYAIPPLEAENMKYVAANSKVAVPKVDANFVDPETQKRYIIMDFIPGTDLQKLLPSLTPAEKTTVSERIKETLNELRTIPPPGYFGNLNGTPCIDGVLSTPDNNPIISGPFKDQEELNQGILERLGQRHSPHYIRLLREMVNRTFKDHRTVFTHGDLQPKNIMVERREIHDDGGADFKVTLIDWNLSGWYPEFWDFCNSTLYCQMKPDWLELVPDIFDQYPLEYLMMQVVYSSVFY
ncbi:Aminoglycoside phosphotransferase [Penicillium expansum]|uniref:Aminoglycoside phosphotransferase n=1 Tax=Penicillium expansum TaxID=27334 RepID=A0A0A2K2B1_PENEN|nr:Aminoglycoside phosphotransferase [Penicillium expansum]KGO36258.1 Aminoglycoside phosphotransferase [Penicillium expansum]KGO46014.1 Aminoglycoside phosphotransferase [Penicillium expansum]KGO61176.1 Aminoglycoside phosphotransferase [Penicillium expansum]